MKRSIMLLGALALLSMAACQREAVQETVTPSPYYDSESNTVKTSFILNVSTNTGKDTKTTAEFAQVNSDFLGMDAVHILSYSLPYANDDHGHFFYKPVYHNPETNVTAPMAATRDFSLGTLFSANSVDDNNASRSVELALPLGTNAVVLYGRALKTYSDDLQGVSVADGNPADLTSLSFSLQSRLSNKAAFDAGAYFFTRMLTYFITTGLINEGTFWNYTPISTADNSYHFWWPIPDATVAGQLPASPVDGTVKEVNGREYQYYAGELSWKQLGTMYRYEFDNSTATLSNSVVTTKNGTPMPLSPLGEVLGRAYQELTVIHEDAGLHEIRGGAATAVLRTMRDLYAVVERASDADATSWSEEVAQQLADQLKIRMDRYFAVSTDGSIDFKKDANGIVDVAGLITVLSSCTSTEDWNSNKDVVNTYLDKDYFYSANNEGFPLNVGLPKGAAALTCDVKTDIKGIDTFYYAEEIPAYGMGDVTFPISSYRYPAELMYFGNSPIRVNTAEKKASDYPSTVSLWDNEGQWTGWTSENASVRSDTRSVAMINNINYGTALLASTVKFGATTLKDNNHALHETEEDQSIPTTFTDASKGFFVTGIIVGGQADVMGWEFVRKPTNIDYTGVTVDANGKYVGLTFEGNSFDKMIYDKVTNPIKVGTATEPIYTMVWDNYDHTKAANAQSDVYVGVELVNNTDMDLWGEMNLIRKGGTFYLLGKLDLATAVATARENNAAAFTDLDRKYYCYPPYDPETGKTINAPRVFMQDYMTKANLILGEDALKHAYVTVPDLRSSQVSLGVSIDMEWESGLAFDVQLGGGQ